MTGSAAGPRTVKKTQTTVKDGPASAATALTVDALPGSTTTTIDRGESRAAPPQQLQPHGGPAPQAPANPANQRQTKTAPSNAASPAWALPICRWPTSSRIPAAMCDHA